MLVLLVGMTGFFLLASLLSGMLGEGPRVQRLILTMSAVCAALTALFVIAGGR